MTESVRVDVGGEVADCGLDAFVEGGAEGEVAAETHAGGALLKYVSDTIRIERVLVTSILREMVSLICYPIWEG